MFVSEWTQRDKLGLLDCDGAYVHEKFIVYFRSDASRKPFRKVMNQLDKDAQENNKISFLFQNLLN